MFFIDSMYRIAIALGGIGILGGLVLLVIAPLGTKRKGLFSIALGIALICAAVWVDSEEKRTVMRFMKKWQSESFHADEYSGSSFPTWADEIDWHRAEADEVPRESYLANYIVPMSYGDIVYESSVMMDLRAGEFIKAGRVNIKIFSTNVHLWFRALETTETHPLRAVFWVADDNNKIIKLEMQSLDDPVID
jgi:hypothetical protein